MAREGRKAALRARLGLEALEGRDLQSSLGGGVAASAPLIRPPAASASAYHTTVWGRSDQAFGTPEVSGGFHKVKIDFATIKVGLAEPAGTRIGTVATGDGSAMIMVRSATVQSEFATIKGESAPIEDGKGSPILM